MDTKVVSGQEEIESGVKLNEKESTSRREFFERFGKFALYTPPAVMLLMSAQTEAAFGSNCPGRYCSSSSSSVSTPQKSRLQKSGRKASRLQKPEENR